MVTGTTRNYSTALADVRRCIDARPGHRVVGVSLALCRGRTVFVADTAVHDMPTAEELADIAMESAGLARRMGYHPRVALLAYSTFGHPSGERSERVREAVAILDSRRVDFEYDGEMAADVALNWKVMEQQYPFCSSASTSRCRSRRWGQRTATSSTWRQSPPMAREPEASNDLALLLAHREKGKVFEEIDGPAPQPQRSA
jgi:phosphotransacetylase